MPITLCNVIYKIIANVLANRLKFVLPAVISETHSAFVPSWLIIDNVMGAYEHYMKRKRQRNSRTAALKLDMSKAYDRALRSGSDSTPIGWKKSWRVSNQFITTFFRKERN